MEPDRVAGYPTRNPDLLIKQLAASGAGSAVEWGD
jgi:hypothetical protein